MGTEFVGGEVKSKVRARVRGGNELISVERGELKNYLILIGERGPDGDPASGGKGGPDCEHDALCNAGSRNVECSSVRLAEPVHQTVSNRWGGWR